MVSREDIERFLDRIGADGASYAEVEPGLWRVRAGGSLNYDIAVTYAPPVLLLRVNVMELPAERDAQARLARRLLELNAGDLLHGAYGIERDTVVLTEALELSHLDYEEFLASFESITLALAAHMPELAACCDPRRATGEHRAAARPVASVPASPAAPASTEAR